MSFRAKCALCGALLSPEQIRHVVLEGPRWPARPLASVCEDTVACEARQHPFTAADAAEFDRDSDLDADRREADREQPSRMARREMAMKPKEGL